MTIDDVIIEDRQPPSLCPQFIILGPVILVIPSINLEFLRCTPAKNGSVTDSPAI
jgi:hypothetical protein